MLKTLKTKRIHHVLHFVKLVNDYRLNAEYLAEFLQAVTRAFKAGEREANGRGTAEKARRQAERSARSLGWEVKDWPGLWPTVRDERGRDVFYHNARQAIV